MTMKERHRNWILIPSRLNKKSHDGNLKIIFFLNTKIDFDVF